MTETEREALALVNEVLDELKAERQTKIMRKNFYAEEALCRAIEQHEAFRQEVSDYLTRYYQGKAPVLLRRFIIAKPDPLVEAVDEGHKLWMETLAPLADSIRAAIEKRGGKIVWGEG